MNPAQYQVMLKADPIPPLHIPHWSEGLVMSQTPRLRVPLARAPVAPSVSTGPAPDSLLNFQLKPGESRRAGEKRQWLESLSLFTDLWRVRTQDTIGCDHPLAEWVLRQRKLFHSKKLMAWKLRLLTRFAFPFVSAPKQATPDNMDYAHQLCAFYVQHGHYAPTQTNGGKGLTRWSRLMRDSKGLAGMITEDALSAAAALSHLKREIPGFDLTNTIKRNINVNAGLSFNGFVKRTSEPVKRGSRRCRDVMVRVVNAIAYPVAVTRLAPGSRQDEAAACLIDIVRRAAFYQQALRVSITNELDPCCAGVWWLYATQATPVDQPSLSLTLRRTLANSHLTYEEIQTPPMERAVSRGYANDGTLYTLTFQCSDGTRLQLDYDALLADQTHVGACPLAYQEGRYAGGIKARRAINWAGWLSGEDRPAKLLGPLTTANAYFESNLYALRTWFEHESPVVNGRHTRQLDWSICGRHYKFVEHMILKARQGNIQTSHAERLIGLDFTWGSEHLPAREVLASTPYFRNPRGKPLRSARMTWLDKLAHRINLKALKADAAGKMVLVYGEDDRPQRFKSATARHGTLEIKYYASPCRSGRLYSTFLDSEHAWSISFQGTGLKGVDDDGEPVYIDFSASPLRGWT